MIEGKYVNTNNQQSQSSAYQVGQIYEDKDGNKAKWTGSGWQEI